MFGSLIFVFALALASAFAAIALGRNLTRSIMAGYAFIGALGVALLMSGAGFLALSVAILGALMLGTLQLFGWMLVDVDRDHLAPTDRPTGWARGIAFGLLGLGLMLLVGGVWLGGEFSHAGPRVLLATPGEVGTLLFGELAEATILIGLTIAASLLAVLLLLQDDEENGR